MGSWWRAGREHNICVWIRNGRPQTVGADRDGQRNSHTKFPNAFTRVLCVLLAASSICTSKLLQLCSISSFAFWLLSLALSCFPCLFRRQPSNVNFARFMVRTHRRSYPALSRYSNCCKDALDTGSNKSALLSCNKLLKKYPKNDLLKVRHIRLHRRHIQS